MEMTQAHSLSLRLTFTSSQYQGSQKRHAKTCVQTCSFWKRTVVCSYLLLLILVFLVFLMVCCNRSSLKSARPMCDARPFRLSAFSPNGGSRHFSAVSFFGGLHNLRSLWLDACLYKTHRLAIGRLLCTGAVARTKSVTCLQVGPMPREWPMALPAGPDRSSSSSSHEDLLDEHPGDALPAIPHLHWRNDALQPPPAQRGSLDRNTCVHIPDGGLRCVIWNTRGLIGSVHSTQISREVKLNYFGRLIENNNVICLQEVHGKDEFLQAIQVWAPRFRLYGTLISGNANAGGSAICIHKDLLSDDAIVTHVYHLPRS